MANKHLKKIGASKKQERSSGGARHTKAAAASKKAENEAKAEAEAKAKAAVKPRTGRYVRKKAPAQEQVVSLTEALTAQVEASLAKSKGEKAAPDGTKAKAQAQAPAPKHALSRKDGSDPSQQEAEPAQAENGKKKKSISFRREKAKKLPGEKKPLLSHRDRVGAVVSLIAASVLLAATAVVWFYKDSFSPDGMILSADTAAVAQEEYVFDAGSGEAFSAAGRGLAVANTSGFELLDADGTAVTSMVMQMESPAAAGCDSYAVFYDLGGRRMAVARFDGSVEELDIEGNILSATVSEGGYLAVTTEQTGYRALVTVYDPNLDEVYKWYSSSAWVLSAIVSPDNRKLAVLGYTASGSEVRIFRLSQEEQLASYQAEGTVLLDVHWFTSNKLCALSTEQALFFSANGQEQNAYSFDGQYLVGYTFDGSNCAAFALSPYRAGTTATLVSLDPNGEQMGTASVQSEIVCLTASDLEIMVLCSDGAVLYSGSLNEKGRLNGLPGFKYGLLRGRGEALLIASNYAEAYTF